MNYQLARTNTYLGGQLKLDLTLNKSQSTLYIEDFHMSPVSNYTGFAWGTDSDLLNNRHSENIKEYYKKVKNIFYEECLCPALDTKYPIYSPNYLIDTHAVDDKMGLYRLPLKTYKKAYSFFCPFWITDASKFLGTEFRFNLYQYENTDPTDNSDKRLVYTAVLCMNEIVGKTFHNNFVKYFDEYLKGFASHDYDITDTKFLNSNVVSNDYLVEGIAQKDTSIEQVLAEPFLNEDLLYISFKDGQAWAKGIDPSTGSYMSKDVSYICETLLSKERPLMDNDYYLARIFKDNLLIAQQLINFNFIFDLSDILPYMVYERMQYQKIGVEVEIYQDGEKLALKDFYSNYEFIPKAKIELTRANNNIPQITYTDNNVLDYKKNADYIEYVYKNKLLQNVVHWSVGDTDYIFNFFDGFSPLINTDGDRETSGIMPGCPNIAVSDYSLGDQNVMWAKVSRSDDISDYTNTFTYFTTDKNIIEGVKYEYDDTLSDNDIQKAKDGFWVLLCPTESTGITFTERSIYGKYTITIYASLENLTFQKILAKLHVKTNKSDYEKLLYWFMQCAKIQSVFLLKEPYIAKTAESPNSDSTEVNLSVPKVKFSDKHPLYRYDGSLQPMLVDIEDTPFVNYSNYIKQYEEDLDNLPAYSQYSGTKYDPNYPSIGYSSIAHEDIDYSVAPIITYYGEQDDLSLPTPVVVEKYLGERRWYNGSFMFTLPQRIMIDFVTGDFDINMIYTEFVRELKSRMNISSLSDDEYIRFVMNYILPLYTYNLKYEKNYEPGTNIPILNSKKEITYKYSAVFDLI